MHLVKVCSNAGGRNTLYLKESTIKKLKSVQIYDGVATFTFRGKRQWTRELQVENSMQDILQNIGRHTELVEVLPGKLAMSPEDIGGISHVSSYDLDNGPPTSPLYFVISFGSNGSAFDFECQIDPADGITTDDVVGNLNRAYDLWLSQNRSFSSTKQLA